MKDLVYHRLLKRPYLLNYHIYPQGEIPVVFLHGINSSINNWQYVLPYLSNNIKPVLIDLAGFGMSAKPAWPNYDINFHTKQIQYTLSKIGYKNSLTIVGHSMGGLIAIELAKNNPGLASNLVLINTPLYGNKQIADEIERSKKSNVQATNILFAIYEKVLAEKDLTLKGVSKILKYMPKDSAFSLSKETWLSFEKSLKNTIMHQNSIAVVSQLTLPIYFMNGLTDVLTITKNQVKLANNKDNVQLDYIPSGHMINKISGKKIANKINQITFLKQI
jgi:pimeloyl-ACP methyl ester carboxylesterase